MAPILLGTRNPTCEHRRSDMFYRSLMGERGRRDGIEFRLRPLDPASPLLGRLLASHDLMTAIRRTVALGCLLFAALSVIVGTSGALSAADPVALSVTGVLAGGSVAAAVWVLLSPAVLSGRGAIAFGVFADLGVTVVLGVIHQPTYAAIGTFALVLPGVFVTMHLARSWLVAHLVYALGVIVAMGVRVTGDEPPAAIVAGGILLGAVVVVTPWTLRQTFANVLGRAERAYHDPVTGVLNRWGLDAALAALQELPPNSPVSVTVVDVDRFKAVNDAHGHDAGDRVLRQVAEDLSSFAGQRNGIVARTGGEEFAVVVPDRIPDLAAIPSVAGGRDGDPSVTLSSGVVTTDMSAVLADGAAGVIAQADHLMYRSKRAGGGRATRSEPAAS